MKRSIWLIVFLLFIGGPINTAYAKPTARGFLNRRDIALSRNNLAKAIHNYTKAIELDPLSAEAYVRRGLARRVKGNLNAAIQLF